MCVATKSSYRLRTPGNSEIGVFAGFLDRHKTASIYSPLSFVDKSPLSNLLVRQISDANGTPYHSLRLAAFSNVQAAVEFEMLLCVYTLRLSKAVPANLSFPSNESFRISECVAEKANEGIKPMNRHNPSPHISKSWQAALKFAWTIQETKQNWNTRPRPLTSVLVLYTKIGLYTI